MSAPTSSRSDTTYEMVVGLEVHVQLKTATKIFCRCSTDFGAAPNANTCPVCLALPGALPVLNEHAVDLAIRAALALGCRDQSTSVFARKNYFYPDLPKGYQISQFDKPLATDGCLQIGTRRDGSPINVRITRVHMEEDAGKSVHDRFAGATAVDLNRAGVPLIEIVSEPDLRSSEEAGEYLKALRDVLVYLGVNDGNLEEGSFRCDANVSVMPKGSTELGTRAELKNINSFRFVRQAIDYEIGRQVEVLEKGGKVSLETRLFDNEKGVTRPMRSKEEANDYRYFPEPDLQPLLVPREWASSVTVPRLPQEVMDDLAAAGVPQADARTLVNDPRLVDLHRRVGGDARRGALFVVGELARALNDGEADLAALKFDPALVREVWKLQDDGAISSTAAKDVLAELIRTGEAPQKIVERKGLSQVSDAGALEAVVDAVIARNPSEVEKYKAGKANLLGFFVGQAMKDLKGKGNPGALNALFRKKLG
ncbi:MAG: Asp-tRNA(Asn)/Glu-tRNA(Gln) amidotransferase subunit GatB [Myxococcales bacterium]